MKNKVIFIDPCLGNIAGSQKVALNLFELICQNYDVTLIMRNGHSQHTDRLLFLAEKLASNHIYFPFESRIRKIIGRGKSDTSNKYKFFDKVKTLLTLLSINFFILRIAISIKPKFIYTYDPRGLALSCLFLRFLGLKVIWHLHGELHCSSFVKKIFIFLVDKIIVPSEYISDKVGNNKVSVLYNGFDFSSRNQNKNKNNNVFNLLYVGTLVPHKGLHNVLDALHDISVNLDIVFNIVGDYAGDYKFSYKKIIENKVSKLSDNVKVVFNGWVTDTAPFYNDSDLLVFSSVKYEEINLDSVNVMIKSSEALPTVLIEALSSGVPVIATRVAGVEEIVIEKIDGIIVENSDPSCFRFYLEKIISNDISFCPNEQRIRDVFSLKKMKENFICYLSDYS